MTFEKWVVTPEEWATGFNIKITNGEEIWNMSGTITNRKRLFTDEDRIKMNKMRDEIVAKLKS